MAASRELPCLSAWPDLPPDLLGDVLSRLPSLADRVRLRAVCRPWRTAAKLLPSPPPQLPWIAMPDGAVLDIANKSTYRLPIPNDDGPCYSAGESMFFHHHNDGRCSLVDGLSGAATPLPELAAFLQSHAVNPCDDNLFDRTPWTDMKITKVAISSAAYRDCVLAVVASGGSKSRVFVSTCRPAGEITNSCVVMSEIAAILDIAFFQGKLYAHLFMYEELVAIDLGDGCLDEPTPPGVQPQVRRYTSWIWPPNLPEMHLKDLFGDHRPDEQYLVESNGKLLMVRTHFSPTGFISRFPSLFEVFEADLTDGPRLGWWKKVGSLDGRALFVGTPCSKSVPASDVNGVRGDCIYFMRSYGDPLRDSCVYSMLDNRIMPLMRTSASPRVKLPIIYSRRFPAWFFPVEV